MDRVHYVGDSFLTGTAIAKALLKYAEALARSGTSATVEVPIRLTDGTPSTARILIGPASQVVSDAAPGDTDEIVDDDLVRFFENETRKLQQNEPHRVASETPPNLGEEDLSWVDDL